jgi:cell division septation protein DedD
LPVSDPQPQIQSVSTHESFPESAQPTITSGPPPLRFRVLAGSFDTPGDADQRLADLERQGFSAVIAIRPTPGGKPVQVVAGKYASREAAQAAAARLEAVGIVCQVSEDMAAPSGTLPTSRPAAVAVEQGSRLPAIAVAAVVEQAMFRINAGAYSSEANAQKRLTQIEQHGFAGYISWQETPGGKIFHVIAGKYASRVEANAAVAQLKKLGIECFLAEGL